MEHTVIASFATRRDAEIAVEHLVQKHGIERADIFIRAPGRANTAGVEPAGADVESGHPSVPRSGKPELNGPVEVSVECHGKGAERVQATFEEAGALRLRLQ